MPRVIGGRYGLSSKDFDPAQAKAVFDELTEGRSRRTASPSASTTTSRTQASRSIPAYSIEPDDVVRAVFYGLGADGTVGANKNSVKIIAEDAGRYAQGYFVYDSHKSGRADRLASALRPASDPRALSHPVGQFRRLPPVPLPERKTMCCGSRLRARRSC